MNESASVPAARRCPCFATHSITEASKCCSPVKLPTRAASHDGSLGPGQLLPFWLRSCCFGVVVTRRYEWRCPAEAAVDILAYSLRIESSNSPNTSHDAGVGAFGAGLGSADLCSICARSASSSAWCAFSTSSTSSLGREWAYVPVETSESQARRTATSAGCSTLASRSRLVIDSMTAPSDRSAGV